jgi:hypothetical protein
LVGEPSHAPCWPLQRLRHRNCKRSATATCENLAAIADDLGINSHVEGGAAPILREIAALRAAAPSPAVQQPAEGGWIANTGVQPVADDVLVSIIYRCGSTDTDGAGKYVWELDGDNDIDILWYFPLPAAPTQAEGPSHD